MLAETFWWQNSHTATMKQRLLVACAADAIVRTPGDPEVASRLAEVAFAAAKASETVPALLTECVPSALVLATRHVNSVKLQGQCAFALAAIAVEFPTGTRPQ